MFKLTFENPYFHHTFVAMHRMIIQQRNYKIYNLYFKREYDDSNFLVRLAIHSPLFRRFAFPYYYYYLLL